MSRFKTKSLSFIASCDLPSNKISTDLNTTSYMLFGSYFKSVANLTVKTLSAPSFLTSPAGTLSRIPPSTNLCPKYSHGANTPWIATT